MNKTTSFKINIKSYFFICSFKPINFFLTSTLYFNSYVGAFKTIASFIAEISFEVSQIILTFK